MLYGIRMRGVIVFAILTFLCGYITGNEVDECATCPCMGESICHDMVGSHRCLCYMGWTGVSCETEIDECESNPCQNSGACTDYINGYNCTCQAGWRGEHCETDIDECSENILTCGNGATCHNTDGSANCECVAGYDVSTNCEQEIMECLSCPCDNDGTCIDRLNEYRCLCPLGYNGTDCEDEIIECASCPCQNSAYCLDDIGFFQCVCMKGYNGTLCEEDIDECASNPCMGNSTCNDLPGKWNCTCEPGYEGEDCSQEINECEGCPCHNGLCVDKIAEYDCFCLPGYNISTECEFESNECLSDPCQNGGECNDYLDMFNCTCVLGFNGTLCEENIDDCASNPCIGSECIDLINEYMCNCTAGFEGDDCSQDIDECASNPCQNDATCYNGTAMYNCTCVYGFYGYDCENETNECADCPCDNGGTCVDLVGNYTCLCVVGYDGRNCTNDINECLSDPCQNGATCYDNIGEYNCTCVPGYTGVDCETEIDECDPSPCQHNGTCEDLINDYNCTCILGYNGTDCETDIDECGSCPCMNNGTCYDLLGRFYCNCTEYFLGVHCQIDVDECEKFTPCWNNAMCNDTNGVDNYNCTCVPGYTGRDCETDIDECETDPCDAAGTDNCTDLINERVCNCNLGYNGTDCENEMSTCEWDPQCLNNATCNNLPGPHEFNCTCLPGYTGFVCETEMDTCEWNPQCLNNAPCNNLPGPHEFNCTCLPGYTGFICETEMSTCEWNPQCLNNATCNNLPGPHEFNCTCLPGFNGTLCETEIDECVSSPCINATCIDMINGYVCNCTEFWTGVHCESEVGGCRDEPCFNNATCTELEGADYNCTCPDGYNGTHCETEINECASDPCYVNGTVSIGCQDLIADYNCPCIAGFTGKNCETNVDECEPNPCMYGKCVDLVNGWRCDCDPGYQHDTIAFDGDRCEEQILMCNSAPCKQFSPSTCTNFINGYACSCTPPYTGAQCEVYVEPPTTTTTTTTPAPGVVVTEPPGPEPEEPVQPEEAQEIAASISRVQCGPGEEGWPNTRFEYQAEVISDQLLRGSMVKYICDEDHSFPDGAVSKLYRCMEESNSGGELIGVWRLEGSGVGGPVPERCYVRNCTQIAPKPEGTDRNTDAFTIHTVAEYKCIDGYVMPQSTGRSINIRSAVCEADHKGVIEWRPNLPSCIKLNCPDFVTNAMISNSSTHLTKELRCPFNVNQWTFPNGLIGMTVDCVFWRGRAKWHIPEPEYQCEERNCPALPYISNANVTALSIEEGSLMNVECHPGYRLTGHSSRFIELRCDRDGDEHLFWNNPLGEGMPTCTELKCNFIPLVVNGVADKTTVNVDDSVKFRCLRGYRWEDNSTEVSRSYQCVETGQDSVDYDGTPPNCTAIYCPDFTPPYGATMTPTFDSGEGEEPGGLAPEHRRVDSQVSAECPAVDEASVERFKNGEEVNQIECLETGEWDLQFDDCARGRCAKPDNVTNAYSEYTDANQGSNVTYTCYYGHQFPDGNTTKISYCEGDLAVSWQNVPPACEPVDCGQVQTPENGYASYDAGTTFGLTAQVRCQPGFKHNDSYSFTGARDYRCDADRLWKHEIPDSGGQITTEGVQCITIRCDSLKVKAYVQIPAPDEYSTQAGSRVVVRCTPGFIWNLQGVDNTTRTQLLTCDGDQGKWVPEFTACSKILCKVPFVDTYIFSPKDPTQYYYQSILNYTCVNGYFITGHTTPTYVASQCQENGRWIDSAGFVGIKECVKDKTQVVKIPTTESKGGNTIAVTSCSLIAVLAVGIVASDVATLVIPFIASCF